MRPASLPLGAARGTPARRARVALALLLGAALLAWLLHDAALRQAAARLPQVPMAWWLAAAAALFASYLLRALRLRSEWRARGPVPLRACLRLVMLHSAALGWLPLRSGEIGYLWGAQRLWGVSLVEAGASLLWLRLQDMCVLGALALALLWPAPLPWRVALALLPPLLLATLWPRSANALARRWPQRRWIGALAERGRSEPLGWLYCGANWACKLGAIGGLLAALAGLPPLAGLRGALGGELAGALPLQGPATLGTYEAAVWALVQWPAGGHATPLLVPMTLVVHAFALLLVSLAALAWLTLGSRGAPVPAGPAGQRSPAS